MRFSKFRVAFIIVAAFSGSNTFADQISIAGASCFGTSDLSVAGPDPSYRRGETATITNPKTTPIYVVCPIQLRNEFTGTVTVRPRILVKPNASPTASVQCWASKVTPSKHSYTPESGTKASTMGDGLRYLTITPGEVSVTVNDAVSDTLYVTCHLPGIYGIGSSIFYPAEEIPTKKAELVQVVVTW
ncbi:hypothetical protein ABZN20_08940 [Methylococcus sp. ANG]|uniref:hypothetical protein n=1 Tax=Methylococcus sp. ANG TaxID=3231903 RepID=UPI00345B2ADF